MSTKSRVINRRESYLVGVLPPSIIRSNVMFPIFHIHIVNAPVGNNLAVYRQNSAQPPEHFENGASNFSAFKGKDWLGRIHPSLYKAF